MQIEKTLSYDRAIPASKGYFFAQRKEKKVQINIAEAISTFFFKVGAVFFGSDVSTVRTVITATTITCFVMGYVSDNQYYFQNVAYAQGVVGVIIIIASLTSLGAANIRMLGNIYIYCLNSLNVLNIGLSHFNDKISYQFIIYFFVTNLFFNKSLGLIFSIAMVSVLLCVVSFFPYENSSSLSDFFLSYAISAFALAVLMLRRFRTEAQVAENELKYRLLADRKSVV